MNNYQETQIFQYRWAIFSFVAITALLPTLLMGAGEGRTNALLIILGILLLVGILLSSMKQVILIDSNGVSYKQSPFHRKFQVIPWADIQDWKVTKINALGDFGGWGIRITSKKKGYIMEGEYGLELQTGAKKLTVLSVKNKIAVTDAMKKQ